jgi:hypothetical protein
VPARSLIHAGFYGIEAVEHEVQAVAAHLATQLA